MLLPQTSTMQPLNEALKLWAVEPKWSEVLVEAHAPLMIVYFA